MERLTDTTGQLYACGNSLCAFEPKQMCSDCKYQYEANNRLAAYEDTDLTPEEVAVIRSALDGIAPVQVEFLPEEKVYHAEILSVPAEGFGDTEIEAMLLAVGAMVERQAYEISKMKTEMAQYQIPMLAIQENWNPSQCPRCKENFRDYEPCDDGYYKRAMSLERCPYCGQKLKWYARMEE